MEVEKEVEMKMEMDASQMLLAKVRLACELAAPSEETVESLLRLVLGSGEEASPIELEACLRSLGLRPTPPELQQLLAMFGVPCLVGAPCVDISSLIDAVLRARVAPQRQPPPALVRSAVEVSALGVPPLTNRCLLRERVDPGTGRMPSAECLRVDACWPND